MVTRSAAAGAFKTVSVDGLSIRKATNWRRREGPYQNGDRITFARVCGEARRSMNAHRKTVTALFADIKGSTELMRDLDPEEAGTPSTQTSPIRDRSQTPSELGSWQD
jgi:hypothetical protein